MSIFSIGTILLSGTTAFANEDISTEATTDSSQLQTAFENINTIE